MKLTYRPEIDGLRAIAVGAVILYHAQITILGHQPFKGGFIGVDIFFVISGYLITSIILKELVTTGSFSFKYFYERRVRRILPALLFVMLLSFPFAWMYLLPSSFVDFSKSILYSLGFSSNFYFEYSGQQYGAESGFLKPFLHTWSLSVEEQFYILFPIVLLFTFKYFRKYLIHILILGFIISLCLADWGSKNYPTFNFYILPTRGWELLAGSILAYFEIINGYRCKNKSLNLTLPFIGLILIGYSIVFFDDEIFHPSFYTLSPIIGACLVIWFSNKNELITKVLSTKLFVGVGLISYSLYLWHYPIFAFSRITNFVFLNDLLLKFFLIFLSIILSIFSYNFIERPARKRKTIFKSISYPIFFFLIIILIFNYSVLYKNGYKNRFHSILDVQDYPILREPLTFKRCNWGKTNTCYFNKNSNKKIFIIGDSHVWTIIPGLKNKITNKGYQFVTSAYPGCYYFYKFNKTNRKTGKINKDCPIQSQYELLSKVENSIIIFFGRLPLYLTNFYFNNGEGGLEQEASVWDHYYSSSDKNLSIEKTFQEQVLNLEKKNKIILVYPFPEAGFNVPNKLLNLMPRDKNKIVEYLVIKNYITTSHKVYKDRTKSSFELLNSIQGKNIYRVYPHSLFCDTIVKDRCVTHDDKNIFYADDNHPSLKGAEMINDLIMKEIEKIELKSN